MGKTKSFIAALTSFLAICLCVPSNNAFAQAPTQTLQADRDPYKPDDSFYDKYDSVKFYRDVDLTHLQGKEELSKDSLRYPFAVFKYKRDTIELVSFFNKHDIKKWTIKKTGDFWYAQFMYREKMPVQDEYVTYFFTKNGRYAAVYTADKKFDITAKLIAPYLIIYDSDYNDHQLKSESYRYLQNKTLLLLDDVLSMNRSKLDTCYLEYSDRTEVIRNNQLYLAKDYLKDLRTGKTKQQKKDFLSVPDFIYPSLFYYLIHDQTLYYTAAP